MTTPSGQISATDINNELGRAGGASLNLNDSGVRGLAGIASGQISFNDLRGKTFLTFSPVSGTPLSGTDFYETSVSISASTNVQWRWSGSPTSASVGQNGTSTGLTLTLSGTSTWTDLNLDGQVQAEESGWSSEYTQGTIIASVGGVDKASWNYTLTVEGVAPQGQ